jgi:EmrB/QacA subfamily drug resistance transporter
MERKWWTLVAVCVATLMLLIDVTIVNVALPNIQTELHASFSDVQWVIDAYSLTLAALLLTAGSLADLFGRRLVFTIGLVVFTTSSLLSGLAPTPLFLNLARGAQGVGGAMLFATSLALLAQTFRGRERGTAFGVWGAITGLAVAIGPVVGGALTSGLSWRWIFLVNVPIGIGAVFLTLARVDESRAPQARRPDFIGLVTFSGALGAIVYALIKSSSLGWGSPTILACLIGGGVLLVVFLIAELVQSDPMFDLSLFRKPTFVGGSIAAFALSAGLFSLLLFITLYVQDILGFTPFQAGIRLLVISGGIMLTSTLAGRLTTRVPIRLLIGPGLMLVAIGVFLMRGIEPSTPWTHLIPGFIIAGIGTGLINPPLASTAVGVVEPQDAGMASGINTTFRQVGIATGVAALGAIFAHHVRTDIVAGLSNAPGIGGAASERIASAVSQGSAVSVLKTVPPSVLPHTTEVVRASFVSGLNEIFLIGSILAAVSSVLTLILIRNRDFTAGAAHDRSDATPVAAPVAEAEPAPVAEAEPSPESEPIVAGTLGDPAEAAGVEAVLRATDQALQDLRHRIEQLIEEHRDAALATADAQARELRSDALAESERYAGRLRGRAEELASLSERCRVELHAQSSVERRAAAGAAAARAELYRLIGEIGALADEALDDVTKLAADADGRPSDGERSPGGQAPLR